jgi:hypothetical protein
MLDVMKKCSGRPLAPAGRQNVAQGQRGQEPFAPAWVSIDQFFSSPPESRASGRFGGRGWERGSLLASGKCRVLLLSDHFSA